MSIKLDKCCKYYASILLYVGIYFVPSFDEYEKYAFASLLKMSKETKHMFRYLHSRQEY